MYRLLKNDSESFAQNSINEEVTPNPHSLLTTASYKVDTIKSSYSNNISKQTASRRHSTAVTPTTTFGQQNQRRHLTSPSKPPATRRHSYIHGSSSPASHEESCHLSKIPVKSDYFSKENVGPRSLDTTWQLKNNNMFRSSGIRQQKSPFLRRPAYSCSQQTTNI